MKPKSIGLIGGAGPLAGAYLLERILALSSKKFGAYRDADFPKIVLISFPFSEMLIEGFDAAKVRSELKECLALLRQNGAAVLAIACNTLHGFLEKEEDDMVHLIRPLKDIPMDTPLVLCTSTSTHFALHRRFFPCAYPDRETQREVDGIIDQILKGENALRRLRSVIQRQKARTIVLGCTELSLFSAQLDLPKKLIIDPLEIMANKIVTLSWRK
jgi:aspartate racemase